ncbi:MAG: lamin tail domain-containing protein [Myxococcales bacterium]|nr:lamin tail domain-containing protein [Myxococcales bacterium]
MHSTIRRLLTTALSTLAVAGCGVTTRPDPNRTLDFATPKDGGVPGADQGIPDSGTGGKDMPIPDDLGPGKQDLAVAGCTKIPNWPGLLPEGTYDDVGQVTYVASTEKGALPSNALLIEDYLLAPNEKWPKSATFKKGDLYADCEVCASIALCDNMGCDQTFFAQGGTVTVTRADRNPKTGRMIAKAQNLTLVAWDFDMDEPVKAGKCYEIGSASFDVTWGAATDGGVPQDLKASDMTKPADLAKPPGDLAGADLAKIADMAPAPDMALSCTPRVNEVQVAGASATDEWVELFNPCVQAVNLNGWKLVYRSTNNNAGMADTTIYTFTETIAAGAYFLIVGDGYVGMKDATASGGLAAAGGAVGLRDPIGFVVDSVAYEVLAVANNLTEKAPAPNPPASQSIARTPNGTDTNDNSKDFKLTVKPSPRLANP